MNKTTKKWIIGGLAVIGGIAIYQTWVKPKLNASSGAEGASEFLGMNKKSRAYNPCAPGKAPCAAYNMACLTPEDCAHQAKKLK